MIILASNSPTRAKILQAFNINFQQISCDYDETLLGSVLSFPYFFFSYSFGEKKEGVGGLKEKSQRARLGWRS